MWIFAANKMGVWARMFSCCVLATTSGGASCASEFPGTGSFPETPSLSEKVTAKTDLVYGQAESQKLLCDLYLPKDPKGIHPLPISS